MKVQPFPHCGGTTLRIRADPAPKQEGNVRITYGRIYVRRCSTGCKGFVRESTVKELDKAWDAYCERVTAKAAAEATGSENAP